MSERILFLLLVRVLDATLKGTVVIVLVAIVQRLIGSRLGARWRYALWLVVILRLAIPVAPSSSWSIFNLLPASEGVPVPVLSGVRVPLADVTRHAMSSEIVTGSYAFGVVWRWVLAVWLCGATVLLLRSVIAAIRVRVAIGRRRQAAALHEVEEIRRRLGIAREVSVLESDLVDAPALHGLVRPTLLLPKNFHESFDRDELRHVALHELWHLRRLDVAVNWMLAAVAALHWFNPLVWFAVSRIREERELACDELALSCLEEDERLGYGRTILKLLEHFRAATPVPALVGIVDHKQKMKRRIQMIASYRNRSRFPMLFVAALALIGAIGLTDARGGERHVLGKLDPAAIQTMEKLGQRVTLDVTDASFGELINLVANATGVTITQSPGTAASPVQQAKFSFRADNVPAHALLQSSLMPFHLVARPDANGVTIFQVVNAEAGEGEHIRIQSAVSDGGEAQKEKRIEIHIVGEPKPAVTADGKLHRELTFKMNENGVESEGKLTLDITGVK